MGNRDLFVTGRFPVEPGSLVWQFSGLLPSGLDVEAGRCYWIEITGRGMGSGGCNIFMPTSVDGNGYAAHDLNGNYNSGNVGEYSAEDIVLDTGAGVDLSFCIEGMNACGDHTGSCCDQNSDCTDNVQIPDCLPPTGHFIHGETCVNPQCASIAPPLANCIFDVNGTVKKCTQDADCKAGETGPDPQTVCRDSDGDSIRDACYVARQRFLSIKPSQTNSGLNYAYRVSLDTTTAGLAVLGYVGEPVDIETVGPGPGLFHLSRVEDFPHFMDWTSVPAGVITIGDCETSHGHSYLIQSIKAGDDLRADSSYSHPLPLSTSKFHSDLTGGGNPGDPPNGANGAFVDIFSTIKGFQGTQNEPKDWLDMEPNSVTNSQPNLQVTLADTFAAVLAFRLSPYLGPAPLDCP